MSPATWFDASDSVRFTEVLTVLPSTVAPVPVTVTDCEEDFTDNRTSTTVLLPAPTFSRTGFFRSNPAAVTCSVYGPTGRNVAINRPASSVVNERVLVKSVFRRTIFASAIGRDWGSRTVPVTEPIADVDCANEVAPSMTNKATVTAILSVKDTTEGAVRILSEYNIGRRNRLR